MKDIKIEELLRNSFLEYIKYIQKNKNKFLAKDYDQEDLHQIRVTIRKIRALSSLLSKYFQYSHAKECKDAFALIAEYTNEARDLDVYLSKIEQYKEFLPKELKNNLNKVVNFLLEHKDIEYKRLHNFFQSDNCVNTLSKYKAHIDSNSLLKSNDKLANEIAKKKIKTTYFKIIKNGSKLNAQSENNKFHKVRIEFKKIRYLIEFFKPIYEKNRYRSIISKLKKIQDLLGDFNDYEVQQKKLHYFINILDLTEEETHTLNLLIQHFETEKQKIKTKFHEKFGFFCKTEFRKELLTIV